MNEGAAPLVTVVVAARDAAVTICDALESLRAQTLASWECIVVDDGSTDSTPALARSYAAPDRRFTVVSQEPAGSSAARNVGIARARAEWLLFLDADDWLVPNALERLVEAAAGSGLDGVHTGWARVAADGSVTESERCSSTGDLFSLFADYCAFAVHACLVRLDVVRDAGGFDPALVTCEDWDLWQRIARGGARFGTVPATLAMYRMRPESLSMNAEQLLRDGLLVIERGHSPDARVARPAAAHAAGKPRTELACTRMDYTSWVAGLAMGCGADARPLLDVLPDERCPGLDPQGVAFRIFRTALLPHGRGLEAWDELWPSAAPDIGEFFAAVEARSGAWRFARRARHALERFTLGVSHAALPLVRGTTMAVDIEVTAPLADVAVAPAIERVIARIKVEGDLLGDIELPAIGGTVKARVLADAIAAEYAWSILGRFYGRHVYDSLGVEICEQHANVWRNGVRLCADLPAASVGYKAVLHDRAGWSVFLQDVWGRLASPPDSFYDPQYSEPDPAAERRSVAAIDGWVDVEVAADLPDVEGASGEVTVACTVGGVAVAALRIPNAAGLRAQALLAAITEQTGFELCRVAVREALIGRSLDAPGSLRERLAARVAERSELAAAAEQVAHSARPSSEVSAALLAPGWRAVAAAVLPSGGVVLARHLDAAVDSTAARRAVLPYEAAAELLESAESAGEPCVLVGEVHAAAVYAPELVWRTSSSAAHADAGDNTVKPASPQPAHHFEPAGADPWRDTMPYERGKYEQTLALVPPGRIRRALELGCAEGHFTARLAERVESLTAADVSEVALQRAAERCSEHRNVEFVRLDLTRDVLPASNDLIVCSEALYHVGTSELDNVAARLADALAPGGHLVTAHANLLADDPEHTGYDWALPYGARTIGETLARVPSLEWVKEVRTELYRVQLFRRRREPSRLTDLIERAAADAEGPVIETAECEWPDAAAAAHIRMAVGAAPSVRAPERTKTSWLPILRYHRVADSGGDASARRRVSLASFEAQLRYLRDAGFRSVRAEEWLAAARARRPLDGRAVLITFDDGYRDFATDAWPLLHRYGFSATVFLVSDLVGKTNEWDAELGETLPLLGWDEIRRLHAEGVEFGSHGATHRPMTALSAAELVAEAAQSRAAISRALGRAITTIAYPHGDEDRIVHHLAGACGYLAGFTCRPGRSALSTPALALPRIEVAGTDDLPGFIAKLGEW